MLNVLSKLAEARLKIKASPIKKDAKNEYSKYDYFSPELVSKLVNDACIEADAIAVFNLKKDEFGYYGELTFTDMESGESLTTIMRTEKPVITATNETQQMGGMNTYAKRYALMSLFDIEDNTIDFDGQDNTKSKPAQKTEPKTNGTQVNELPWLNKSDPNYYKIINRLQNKTATIQQIKDHYKINKQIYAELEAAIKNEDLNYQYDAGDLPY